MIDYSFKRFLLLFRVIMFNKDVIKCGSEDIIIWHKNKSENDTLFFDQLDGSCYICNRQYTLFNDLNIDLKVIISKFSKTIRNEVHRAEKVNIKQFIIDSYDQENELFYIKMEKVYEKMFKEKGQRRKLNLSLIRSGLKNKNIIITVAKNEDDEILVYHVYLHDKKNVLLLYSTSYSNRDKDKAKIIGWANKFLHYKDIEYFKFKKYTNYEWGGIKNPEQPNGIDKFKMGFGGEIVSFDNVIVANSIKGKIYIKLLKLAKAIKLWH